MLKGIILSWFILGTLIILFIYLFILGTGNETQWCSITELHPQDVIIFFFLFHFETVLLKMLRTC